MPFAAAGPAGPPLPAFRRHTASDLDCRITERALGSDAVARGRFWYTPIGSDIVASAGETMNIEGIARGLCAVALSTTLMAGGPSGSCEPGASGSRDAALDKAIPPAMHRASVHGAIVGIWQDGHAPYVRTFGVRDTVTRQPMATNLYMRIGSNSKAFTVTALLMLADQGKLGLDDPIDRYVKGVPSGSRITLTQLAQMRSGLYNYADDTNKDLPRQPFRQWTPHELLTISFRRPLQFAPGTAFDYSNTNTV